MTASTKTLRRIEKGVPLPQTSAYRKYPFGEMGIGDSFVDSQKRACSAARAFGSYHGIRFTTRKQADGQYRIWRLR